MWGQCVPGLTLQAVQRYTLTAALDQPGIADAAGAVRVSAECAVPLLTVQPAGGALEFGEAFLGHPYSATFTLVNDSKLPGKFEVLPQVQTS